MPPLSALTSLELELRFKSYVSAWEDKSTIQDIRAVVQVVSTAPLQQLRLSFIDIFASRIAAWRALSSVADEFILLEDSILGLSLRAITIGFPNAKQNRASRLFDHMRVFFARLDKAGLLHLSCSASSSEKSALNLLEISSAHQSSQSPDAKPVPDSADMRERLTLSPSPLTDAGLQRCVLKTLPR